MDRPVDVSFAEQVFCTLPFMDFDTLLYDVADGVLTLTLNRPEKLNAFTLQMGRELIEAFDAADADDGVRAIVVTGAGRGFCAGADLSEGAEAFDPAGHRSEQEFPRDLGGEVSLRIFASAKPVIAAINGPAVGVGATMTLPMDIRIAAEGARMGFVFARRGIVPEAASTWFLPRVVGIAQATEWVMTGRVFDAEEALRGGLVRSVHDDGGLLQAAHGIAREIAEHTSAVSVALSRQMLWRGLTFDHPMQAHRAESRGMVLRGAAGDAREGVTAFLEKRPAVFPDRVSDGLPDVFGDWEEPAY